MELGNVRAGVGLPAQAVFDRALKGRDCLGVLSALIVGVGEVRIALRRVPRVASPTRRGSLGPGRGCPPSTTARNSHRLNSAAARPVATAACAICALEAPIARRQKKALWQPSGVRRAGQGGGSSDPSEVPDRVLDLAGAATAPATWLRAAAADGGVPLTQTQARARIVVREVAERLAGWWKAELFGPPHREADLAVLGALHDGLRRLRLVRRRGRVLHATARGRVLAGDPAALLEALAGDLGGSDPFTEMVAGEVIRRSPPTASASTTSSWPRRSGRRTAAAGAISQATRLMSARCPGSSARSSVEARPTG